MFKDVMRVGPYDGTGALGRLGRDAKTCGVHHVRTQGDGDHAQAREKRFLTGRGTLASGLGDFQPPGL